MRFFKTLLLSILFLGLGAAAKAQTIAGPPCTTSQNVQFQIPNIGNTTNWGYCLNADITLLDNLLGGIGQLSVSNTTPSVAGKSNWQTGNVGIVTLTNFLNGYPGQSIKIICGSTDTFTQILSSTNIIVDAAWTCASSTAINLTLTNGKWIETGRGGATGGGGGGVSLVSSGNLSPLFTVSVSNPATTPAFSFSPISVSANQVYANCTTSSGIPNFCSLTAAMIPVIPLATGVSGTLPHGSLPTLLSADIPNNAANTTGNAATATTITTTLPHNLLPTLVSGDIPNNAANTSGNAATASALASTPTTCSANNAATGISANGNATGCFAPLLSALADPGSNGILKRTALNVTAIAVAGTDYVPATTTVNSHALSSNVVVSASDLTTGTLPHAQLPALVSGDIPNNAANTTGNAATATALAATPSNCGAGTAATGIAANGNAVGCFTPAPFYQTVDANGTAQTQRAALNLIAGSNMTVSCADNSGQARTDCTLTASSTSSTAFSAITAATNSNTGTFSISGGAWDFGAAASLKVPVSAGLAPTISGQVGYDSTNNKWVFGQNGAVISFGLASGACGSHQFVNTPATAIAAASCVQPAFTDISGTVAASQLPNPSSSTLGGVESFAAVSHQFINQISTSGVVSAAQPSLSDLSAGTAAASMTFPGGTDFSGGVNAQSGATYTVVSSDENKLLTFNNASSVAVTLPQSTTSGFGQGATFYFFNRGAGAVTVTPTTSTINGNTTIVLNQNQGAFIESDGTNYSAWVSASPSGSGTVTSVGLQVNSASSSGILSVSGSPVTSSGNLNLTLSGTTGGVPYFSSSSVLLSSGQLTQNGVVLGGGTGAPTATAASTTVTNALFATAGAPAFRNIGSSDTSIFWYATDTGSANAYAIAPTPAVTALTVGTEVSFKTTNANSGGSTINVSSLGVKNITKFGTSNSLSAGDITSGTVYYIVYDGTEWQLLNPTTAQGTVTSVGASFTGGLIFVGGTPVTTTGTLALTVAGTSGGIPYFSSGTTWASSGALTAHCVVLGQGAGNSPTVVCPSSTSGFALLSNGTSSDPSFQAITSGTVTHTVGALTSGQFVIGNGGADVKADANIDDGVTTAGTITSTEPIAAPSFKGTAGSNGGIIFQEGTGAGLTCGTAVDCLWGDSTAHRLKVIDNAGTATTLAQFTDALNVFASTTSAQLRGVISDPTGTGSLVFATSPTLVTPTLGVATATSINSLTITTSTGTLTIANGKTLTANNSLTLAGTDGTTLTFQGTDTYIGRATTDTITGTKSFNGGTLFNGGIDGQSGTSYTVVAADEYKLLTFNNASAVSVTLPQATTSGFTAGAQFTVFNRGTGAVTITPTTSTVNGNATLVLNQNQGAYIVSDGTNYSAWVSSAPSGSGTVTSVAETFTGGLISVSGSPITTNGTLALTVAGTSGGIPYFSSSSAWASSAVLGSGQFVLGGGAGSAPTTSFSTVPAVNGGSGISNPTAHSLLVAEGSSAFNLVTSSTTNGNYVCSFNVTASAAVDPACNLVGVPVNAQSGSYTLLYSDRASYVKESGGTTATLTLPAISGNFATNYTFVTQNLNSGNLTLTVTSPNAIDGGSAGGSITIPPNFSAFIYSDTAGPNWFSVKFPNLAAFPSCSGASNALTFSTTTFQFGCNTITGGGGSSALSAITAATASNTIANGNFPQVWNFAQTTNSQTAFAFGETTAATGTSDIELAVSTLTTSTAIPFQVSQGANGPLGANAPAVVNIASVAAGGLPNPSTTGAGNIGAPINLSTGAGSAGGSTSGNGGAAGAFNLTTGNGGGVTGATNTGGNGGNINLTTGSGASGGSGTATAGSGGSLIITLGVAGTQGTTAGTAGTVQITGTAPASVSTTPGLNAGTLLTVSGVTGGATSNAAGTAGTGSGASFTGGTGGAGTGTNAVGGAGGAFTFTSGNGGASAGTGANANGGNITFSLGKAGIGGSGAAGATGLFQITGTAPASSSGTTGLAVGTLFSVAGVAGGATSNAAGTAGTGSVVSISSGSGGAGTGTNAVGGAGGAINFVAGNGGASAGTGANSNGGSVIISPGSAGTGGSGTAGLAGVLQVNGPTAGFFGYGQGSAVTATNTNIPANTIVDYAPSSVTSYFRALPGVAAPGVITNTLSGTLITQGYSGDTNHSTTVTTGSGTSVGSTQLCSTTNCPAGTYVVNAYIDVTTACGTSGTYLVDLIYTDDQGSKTVPINFVGTGVVTSTGVLTTTSTANFGQVAQIIRSTGAASINYSTTAVACGSAGPMVGKLYLSVVPVQ